MNQIQSRIETLREKMKHSGLQAWIVPGTDPHMSEYLPAEWNERKYISGFTGSMGYIVITLNDAGLWTDSRYFLQGEEQLKGTGIQLFKKGIPGTPEPVEWIISQLSEGDCVGINSLIAPVSQVKTLKKTLANSGIKLRTKYDLLEELRLQSDASPDEAILLHEKYSGESTASKISRVRQQYTGNWAAVYSALDQIAWLFNIRGKDVVYNPVLIAYALISPKEAVLFTDKQKISAETEEQLLKSGVQVKPYTAIFEHIEKQTLGTSFIIDKRTLNYKVYKCIKSDFDIKDEPSVVDHFKSIKNNTEIAGFKKAMISDGIAMTRFLMWFEKALWSGEQISEYNIGERLKEERSKQEGFMGESFCTIASFNENGAIVHYSPPAEGSALIQKDGVLLFDSGGQYLYGTTDITRTIATGKVAQKAKNDFTRVLQGHIQLASAVFPKGTRGVQLDVLAREKMWKAGLDYGHGTCHGVGHFLNVHEGPQTIRKEGNDVLLEPNMVLTIEPGLYRLNNWGLRVENMVYITEGETTEFGSFLKLENLTLFPIDLRLVNTSILSENDTEWINKYHNTVFSMLAPHLEPHETTWLKEKTRKI